jgi:methionine biosynthesis protein MetW
MEDKSKKKYYADYGYQAGTPETVDRPEYPYIVEWIAPGSKVLDLCCGEGSLGSLLIKQKNCEVFGVDVSQSGVARCAAKGIKAKVGDVDLGLEYPSKSFDYVTINVSLQMVYRPDFVLKEALRVGKQVIVSFPNFAFWHSRLELLLLGKFPPRPLYGYKWYNTRHIHLFSYRDFKNLSEEIKAKTTKSIFLGSDSATPNWLAKLWPNLFSLVCILMIEGGSK